MPTRLALTTPCTAPGMGYFHWLDRAECDLHVPTHRRVWKIQGVAAQPHRHHPGPSSATPADCVLLWRVLEGAAGFGTPVAVTAALLIGLGFKPLQASGLSLIANTAPVAFGALVRPSLHLQGHRFQRSRTGSHGGRILAPFCILVPFWSSGLCRLQGNDRGVAAILVAGVSFAIPQLLVSNLHGPGWSM